MVKGRVGLWWHHPRNEMSTEDVQTSLFLSFLRALFSNPLSPSHAHTHTHSLVSHSPPSRTRAHTHIFGSPGGVNTFEIETSFALTTE